MTDYLVDGSNLTSIANAIRTKGGTSAQLEFPDEFVSAINAIPTGGGAVEEKQVNFIDYDGTILYSYTAQEANALTDLPANPSHTGLTAQGWNWTLAQIKSQLTALPDGPVWVGQSYTPASGKTEIDITLEPDKLQPYLAIAPNGTVSVDWGDGSSASTVTGTSNTTVKYTQHTYSTAGDYTIKITVSSGTFAFYTSSTSYRAVLTNKASSTDSTKYSGCVKAIRMGPNAKVGNCAFIFCMFMEYVTFPTSCTTFGDYAFATCPSLKGCVVPTGTTTLPQYFFSSCYTIGRVSLPPTLTSLPKYLCENNYKLGSITIPTGVTTINEYAFKACSSFTKIYLPSGITTLGQYWLYNCFNILKLTIPATVTSVGNYAFRYNKTLEEYHFLGTTPPTITSTTFTDTNSSRRIYVPTSAVSTYKGTSNWSNQSSYIYGE